MTIKKNNTPVKPAGPATGGATIADRFRLDAPAAVPKAGAVGKTSATVALVAGLAALAVAGVLTYVLYQHWEFLMPA